MLVASSIFTLMGLVIVYKNNRNNHDRNLFSNIGKEGFTSSENFEEMKDNFEAPTTKNPLQNLNATENNMKNLLLHHLTSKVKKLIKM